MPFAKQRERLVRILPGVAGYQDRESARDTDKAVRLRVAAEMGLLKWDLEEEKEDWIERKDLFLLPALDGITSKLDKLENMTRFAARGYRAFFDPDSAGQETLALLYAFDLALFDEVESIREEVRQLGQLGADTDRLKAAIKKLNRSLDEFEKTFSARQEILKQK